MTAVENYEELFDMPVWEWTRYAGVSSTALSATCTSEDGLDKYIYYVVGTLHYRYDTIKDTWQSLKAPLTATVTLVSYIYTKYGGYRGRVISATANTIKTGGMHTNQLNGYVIRIISGTGIGQERTITSSAEPVIEDTGLATVASTTSIGDGLKAWTISQWRGYSVHLTYSTGSPQHSRIIYNDTTTVYVADPNYAGQKSFISGEYFNPAPVITAGSQTHFQIESQTLTINSDWNVVPDSTSRFVILSGGIWLLSSAAVAPFYTFQYYDILSDNWITKSTVTNQILAALGTDVTLCRLGEISGTFANGTTDSAGVLTLVTVEGGMTINRWKNYQLRIMIGTGAGQQRTIISNTATTFTLVEEWDINPDITSTWSVYGDTDKIYMFGDGKSSLYQYSVEEDMWTQSFQYDAGITRNMCSQQDGWKSIGINTITNVGTTATATTSINHNYIVGDIVTIYGAGGADAATYNKVNAVITTVPILTTFTYEMDAIPGAPAVAANSSTTGIIVDAQENWTINEHAGRLVKVSGAGFAGIGQTRLIVSNTATTLTLNGTVTLPTNGTTRYFIIAYDAFGDSDTKTATGGSTTTISTGAGWVVNQWAGKRVKITSGSGEGNEISIISNTINTLTFAAITGLAPDATTVFSILKPMTRGAGIELIWNYGVTNTIIKGKYLYCFRGNSNSMLDRYDIQLETWEYLFTNPNSDTYTTGTMYVYDGEDKIYIQRDATGRITCLDLNNLNITPYATTPHLPSTAIIGNRMEIITSSTGKNYLYIMRHSDAVFWRLWMDSVQ